MSRDYFLNVPRSHTNLMAYEDFATSVAVELGAAETRARSEMSDMVDFEISLANVNM